MRNTIDSTSLVMAVSALEKAVRMSMMSLVSRETTSPVRVVSKNVGSIRMTRRYTASRTSATIRSPIQVIR